MELSAKIKSCNEKAREIVKKVGASGHYKHRISRVGGIHSFTFNETPPSNFKLKKDGGYYPKSQGKENKELIKEIESLPAIDIFEWGNIFDVDPFESTPGFFERDGSFYVSSTTSIKNNDLIGIKLSECAIAKESK